MAICGVDEVVGGMGSGIGVRGEIGFGPRCWAVGCVWVGTKRCGWVGKCGIRSEVEIE